MKLGIAFEGGASRTYFSCGVMTALVNKNIKADIITGSSAGIAYAVSYASWQPERAVEILKKYYSSREYMGVKYLFDRNIRSFYNIPFVFETIPNELVPFDYKAFKEKGIKSVAALTDIETGKCVYKTLDGNDRTWQALVASCALPILFKPVEINGRKYMDGGITDSVPVDYLLQSGCDKVIAVLTREYGYRKKSKDFTLSLAAHEYRRYPEFSNALIHRNENYNSHREYLERLSGNGDIFIIAPKVMDGISRTENDPEKLYKIYEQGIERVDELMPELEAYFKA